MRTGMALLVAIALSVPMMAQDVPAILFLKPAAGQRFTVGDTVEIAAKIYDRSIDAISIKFSNDSGFSFADQGYLTRMAGQLFGGDTTTEWLKSTEVNPVDSVWSFSIMWILPNTDAVISNGAAIGIEKWGPGHYAVSPIFSILPAASGVRLTHAPSAGTTPLRIARESRDRAIFNVRGQAIERMSSPGRGNAPAMTVTGSRILLQSERSGWH